MAKISLMRPIDLKQKGELLQTGVNGLALLRDLAVGAIIGILVALAAEVYVIGTRTFSGLQESGHGVTHEFFGLAFHPVVYLGLAAAALIIWSVRKSFDIQKWEGPADTIFAAHSTRGDIDIKRGLGSTLAAFVSACGGASVGQYGPLVHFGGTLGAFFRNLFRGRITSDIVIGCGVAAAISAGFSAPIAGIIFAHEAVIRHFSFRALGAIACSSVVAAASTQWIFSPPRFIPVSLPALDGLHTLILPLVISGIIFGAVALAYMQSIRGMQRLNKTLGWSWERSILSAVLIVGTVGAFVPEVMGLGGAVVKDLIEGNIVASFVLVLVIGKIFATCYCLSFGYFGGVFSPAMLIGGGSGAILAYVFSQVGIDNLNTVLVLSGMAAVTSSVVGAPLTAVLIILELTESYDFALAALLAVVCSTLFSNLVFGHSFFDRQLLDRGVDLSLGRSRLNSEEIEVASFLSTSFIEMSKDMRAEDAIDLFAKYKSTEAYCTDETGRLIGKINLHALVKRPIDSPVSEVMDMQALALSSEASLAEAMAVAETFVGESIPVVDGSSNEMLGIVTEADIFNAYARLERDIHVRERG